MIEEKVPSDVEASIVTKEKLSTSASSNMEDDVKSDAVLDEIAAKVNALNFKTGDQEEDSTSAETEDEGTTIKRQSEIVKKQSETINTLIQQLRIMFDEYNTACQEKEYYEDLSEALIRYIEIYDGSVEIAEENQEDGEDEECTDDENIKNIVSEDQQQQQPTMEAKTTDASGSSPPNPTPEKPIETTSVATNGEAGEDHTEENTANANTEEVEDDAATTTTTRKPRITNNELIRLNHILLKELIELRNERDLLRESVFYSPNADDEEEESDLTDEDDEEEVHSCQHCSSTDIANDKDGEIEEDEEYENNDNEEDMKRIADESAEDTE